MDYSCNPYINKEYTLENYDGDFELNVNCMNVYFNLEFMINRQRLYEKLLDMNYICKYKPETYSGIKLVYKIPLDITNKKVDGLCHCSTKCTCLNVTFLVF